MFSPCKWKPKLLNIESWPFNPVIPALSLHSSSSQCRGNSQLLNLNKTYFSVVSRSAPPAGAVCLERRARSTAPVLGLRARPRRPRSCPAPPPARPAARGAQNQRSVRAHLREPHVATFSWSPASGWAAEKLGLHRIETRHPAQPGYQMLAYIQSSFQSHSKSRKQKNVTLESG